MTSEKRNFTNFKEFPGNINYSTNNYEFPALYHTDAHENVRVWSIHVRLIKKMSISKIRHSIDWSLLQENQIPIKSQYLTDMELPPNVITQVWVETGVVDGKITRHQPTYPVGKNKGKSDERNSFKQGLVFSRSKYLKKIETGSLDINKYKNIKNIPTITNIMYFPMLVHKYNEKKKNIIYPCYVQPKLDGVRCLVYLNKHPDKSPTIKNVIMYTRQKKEFANFCKIRKYLLQPLIDMYDIKNKTSMYIDGEFYKHGKELQEISGEVRNSNRDELSEEKGYGCLEYHVFDIFYPSNLLLTFEMRLEYIDDLFMSLDDNGNEWVRRVETDLAYTEKEQNDMYKEWLSEKYEGIIIRNSDSLYLTSAVKTGMKLRSKYVLKRKMRYSGEYEIVGYTQGTKGRDIGAILWICEVMHNNIKILFHVTPKNTTYKQRYELFKNASENNDQGFRNNFAGRMLTVEYEDLSKNMVPLRAKSIGFRDHM
jgi:ATP-dependent DNA ligase